MIDIPSFEIPKVELPSSMKNISESLSSATKSIGSMAGQTCDIANTLSSMMDSVIGEAGKLAETAIGAVMSAINDVTAKIDSAIGKLQELGNKAYAKCSKMLKDVIDKITKIGRASCRERV